MGTQQPKTKKERTKDKIFKTALDLFIEQGYENTTVQEITEKADVAKGTFFSHFPTKDAILMHLGEQRIEMMKENFANEYTHIQSAKDQIMKLFELLAIANETDKEVTKLISYEIVKKLNSPDLKRESENQLQLKNIFENILWIGKQNGEFKKEIEPSHVADIFIGIYFFTLLNWLKDDNIVSLTAEYESRVRIVLGGIIVAD